MCAHIALNDPPAPRRVKILQRRARDEIEPWHVQGRTASCRVVEQGAGDPAAAHGLIDPERRQPRREIGLGRLVIVDHQRVAAGLPVDLRDQCEWQGAVRLQEGGETIADLGERRSPVLPERLPYSPCDGGRVLRPLAQVENFGRRRGQATFFARCGNIARRAVSSISVLKVCLSFSASARTAAGRALISAR
jgi:hypothetical protein